MKRVLYLFFFAMLSTNAFSADYEYGEQISIYNVGNGVLIYSYESSPNQYVSADTAYELKGSWSTNANWQVVYVANGKIALKNLYSGLCLQFYGGGYQAVENTCNYDNADQQITPELTSSGALQLMFKRQNVCLYAYAGDSYYYIYTDICSTAKEYLWSLVPALADSSLSADNANVTKVRERGVTANAVKNTSVPPVHLDKNNKLANDAKTVKKQ